jgi:pyruvate formate lyase activating enzyme
MAECKVCGKSSILISKALSVCVDCIRSNFEKSFPFIEKAHFRSRERFNLPLTPPKEDKGVKCNFCVNECEIPLGKRGFCGLRENKDNQIVGGLAEEGNLNWYYDGLPTNCVADWVCAGGTRFGYPKFSYSKSAEYGYKNLAVFYQACSFNCLFCQNWHYRQEIYSNKKISAEKLASGVDEKTSCICYFGGDPTPQIVHSIETSKIALEKSKGKILRICWETNGSMNQAYLEQMIEIALKSGGCIKFDLKAWDDNLHLALCGVSNKKTLENFKFLASFSKERKSPPLVIASTLLVPGYIDEKEIKNIAQFIANLNPEIPYSLLGFYPQFYFNDLPTTSLRHSEKCLEIALKDGLKKVRIGNRHLLRAGY